MNQLTTAASVDEAVKIARTKAQTYRPMSNHALMQAIEESVSTDEVLFSIHQELELGLVLAHHCISQNFPPVLMQFISELVENNSDMACQTMRSTWLAMAIAQSAGLPTTQQHEIFAASLFKDIAFNYLGQKLANDRTPSDDNWRLIKIHPLVSAKLVQSENYFSQNVVNAISQHHERIDHSGYPRGVVSTIPMTSKIVALADQLYRIVRDADDNKYHRLMAYLRINKEELSDTVLNPAIAMFKKAKLDERHISQVDEHHLTLRASVLKQTCLALTKFVSINAKVLQALEHLLYALHQAGLEYQEIINQTVAEGDELEQVELNALILEWFWLYKRFIRVLHAHEPSHDQLSTLSKLNDQFWQVTSTS